MALGAGRCLSSHCRTCVTEAASNRGAERCHMRCLPCRQWRLSLRLRWGTHPAAGEGHNTLQRAGPCTASLKLLYKILPRCSMCAQPGAWVTIQDVHTHLTCSGLLKLVGASVSVTSYGSGLHIPVMRSHETAFCHPLDCSCSGSSGVAGEGKEKFLISFLQIIESGFLCLLLFCFLFRLLVLALQRRTCFLPQCLLSFSELLLALRPPGMERPVAEWHIPAHLHVTLRDGVSLKRVVHHAYVFS